MSLLLDVSNTVDALGDAFVMASPGATAYFQWQVEGTGLINVELALTATLRPDDADSNDLVVLPLATTKKVVAGDSQSFTGSYFSDAIRYDASGVNAKGIFYLEKLPHIIVPRVHSVINGTYTGTWRVRLWGWA